MWHAELQALAQMQAQADMMSAVQVATYKPFSYQHVSI